MMITKVCAKVIDREAKLTAVSLSLIIRKVKSQLIDSKKLMSGSFKIYAPKSLIGLVPIRHQIFSTKISFTVQIDA